VAEAVGFAGEAVFSASALPSAPAEIKVVFGETQRGLVQQDLPVPFVTLVHDQAGNPVGGVPVTFRVVRGGGSIDGHPEVTAITDGSGLASVTLTLGPEPGINGHVVEATFEGNIGLPAVLMASAVRPGLPEDTRVSGVVLDNSHVPVPGATATIVGTALQAVTDDQGRFAIADVPVGHLHLRVDGTTTSRPGSWPVLEYELTALSGQDNTIGMPIFLLPLDTENARLVGGDADVILTMPNIPQFEMKVFAHAAICPGGAPQCVVGVTQVHRDKVPMPPIGGAAPDLVLTVQPPGAAFDPPAKVTFPNAEGLPPGGVTEIFSFDHDLGQYVSVGTASVSEDGTIVVSDPGSGIVKSGWQYQPRGPSPSAPPPCNCDDENPCNGVARCDLTGACIPGENLPLCTACEPPGLACDGRGNCEPGVSLVQDLQEAGRCQEFSVAAESPIMLTCPPDTCGGGVRIPFQRLDHMCDAASFAGAPVNESLTRGSNTNSCIPPERLILPGAGCITKEDNTLIAPLREVELPCGDRIVFCLPVESFRFDANGECEQIIHQDLTVVSPECVAESHTLRIHLRKLGENGCELVSFQRD
jgi:hypothetical protein